jgi:hypothetical protein
VKPNESPAEGAPEAASPFLPAFRWEASPPESPTQQSPSYQQRPDEAGDLFQPGRASYDQGASTSGGSLAPPWAGSDLPPIAEQPIADQQSAWLRQGPEVFQAPATPSRSKQIIGIAVLGIVVLGLLGSAVAYFLTRHSPERTGLDQFAAPQQTVAPRDLPAPPPPLPAPVDTTHALIDPPGQTRGGGGLFDLPQLLAENPKRLQPAIVKALEAGGMTDGVLKTTTVGDTTIGMFALTMPTQQAAATVAETIATAQLDGGLKADNNRALQGMTVMGSVPGSQPTAYRAIYVLYNRTIYVEVFGLNRDDVLATFDVLIKQQVMHAPPTVQSGR